MKAKALGLLFLLFWATNIYSQIGGRGVYQSLTLPSSARAAALGGYQIAVVDDELPLAFQNPSLLNSSMTERPYFSQADYLADISFGFAGYAFQHDSLTTFMAGVQFLNYGDFQRTNQVGDVIGNFSGDDFAVTFGVGRKIGKNLRVGTNVKFIYSHMANYYSAGFAFDLAVTHNWREKQLTSALVVRNVGFQLSTYAGLREPLPVDVQLSVSKKLANAPFRLNITAHHLNFPDITYVNPNARTVIDLETGQPRIESIPLSEKVFRHFIIGGEVLLSKNFHIRVGYNHQRRKELSLNDVKGGVGYSWGFGLRIWRFHIDYGRASYHMAGASNHFTVASSLSSWLKKEENNAAEN